MIRFLIRRLIESIPVMLLIVTAAFFMVRYVPGGPFLGEKALPPEIQHNLEVHYGLDQPLWRQYVNYLGSLCPKRFAPLRLADDSDRDAQWDWDLNAAFGIDFGPSLKYANRTVNEVIAGALPASLELGAWSLLVAIGLGLPLGVLAALRRNTWVDHLCGGVSLLGLSVPSFVLGPILVLVFAIMLQRCNASGWNEPLDRVLPAVTLGLANAAAIARLTRGGMLEVLGQDFIRTARAKGASELRVVVRHALRGGLIPVVSYLGPAAAGILTGAFAVERIFQIPGLGREFVTSAFNRDYPLVVGTVVLYAAAIILFNLLVDIVQVWLNPRLRFDD
jgi:oligopeptide transport system permease protein